MRQWIQITSGRGPAECAWTVARVLRAMIQEASNMCLNAEVLESEPGPFAETLSSVLLAIESDGAAAFLETWRGTIQWIGQSPFRPEYKRKNWFVGVETIAVPIRPRWSEKDVTFDTMRASGPGGQHVNKTESAVRVTHTPTGIAVIAREERSQSANRKLSLARLAERLDERGNENVTGMRRTRWSQHNTFERGNPIRIFEGPRFEPRKPY